MDCENRCKSIFVDIDVMTSYLCQKKLNHNGNHSYTKTWETNQEWKHPTTREVQE